MAFWSSERIIAEQNQQVLVESFDEGRLKHGAYELGLGDQVYITSDPGRVRRNLEKDQQINIPPGQFAFLLSEEVVHIPPHAIGFISIKAGIKFKGLVNISGFHVDSGFHGKLKFSVHNAGGKEITLQRLQRLFLLWFADLDQPTKDVYHGSHQGQNAISSEDVMQIKGELPSPPELERRLHTLEVKIKIYEAIVLALIAVSLSFATGVLKLGTESDNVTSKVSENKRIETSTKDSIQDAN